MNLKKFITKEFQDQDIPIDLNVIDTILYLKPVAMTAIRNILD